MKTNTTKGDISHRFEEKCKISGSCRLWPNKANSRGYYTISINDSSYLLHRVVYWIKSDYARICEIPSELHVRHLCPNKNCTTLDHYTIGTRKENEADKKVSGTAIQGASCSLAKLSLETAQEIADSWSTNKTIASRAKLFDVTWSTIKDIDERRTWPNLCHPNGKQFVGLADRNVNQRKCAKIRHETLNKEHYEAIKERFLQCSDVDDKPGSTCRVWRKVEVNKVYARFTAYGHTASAHVWACEIKQGHAMTEDKPIVRHLCNNPRCVSFDHIVAGTHTENMADVRMARKRCLLEEDQMNAIRESKDSIKNLADKYKVKATYIKYLRRKTPRIRGDRLD